LRNFGLKVGVVGALKFEARIKELVENLPDIAEFGADSEEKHEPVSDIDTAAVDSLKVLDPERSIREADIRRHIKHRPELAESWYSR
jgi:hypothetical protein